MEAEVKETWVSPDGEHKIYTFVNPMTIPITRHLAADVAVRQASLKLSVPELTKLLNAITMHFNNGKLTEAAAIIEEIKYRMTFPAEERTMMDIAFCYTLINDEPKERPSARHNQIKHELLQKYPDLQGFFLLTAQGITSQLQNISLQDIQESFREIAARQPYLNSLLKP